MNEVTVISFDHKVGDFVMTAWDAQTRKPKDDPKNREAWQVIERSYQQHCGGARIQYVCRCQSIFGNKERTFVFDPCELVPMPEAAAATTESKEIK